MNIVLCGMPCVGKTTVAKRLSERCGRRFVDTDEMIQVKYGTISEIFAQCGEEYFRRIECEVAEKLAVEDNLIIATGGGFLLHGENAEKMKTHGRLVYLYATCETLLSRLTGEDRPLLAENAPERMRRLYAERELQYREIADYIIETDGKGLDEIVETIEREVLQ